MSETIPPTFNNWKHSRHSFAIFHVLYSKHNKFPSLFYSQIPNSSYLTLNSLEFIKKQKEIYITSGKKLTTPKLPLDIFHPSLTEMAFKKVDCAQIACNIQTNWFSSVFLSFVYFIIKTEHTNEWETEVCVINYIHILCDCVVAWMSSSSIVLSFFFISNRVAQLYSFLGILFFYIRLLWFHREFTVMRSVCVFTFFGV